MLCQDIEVEEFNNMINEEENLENLCSNNEGVYTYLVYFRNGGK